MKKVKCKLKRVGVFLIILLLCFNNFAAIVSDNDGSAFVTKAEFDALKDNFAAQVQNYENSIGGKIDGAIASYLAGIKLQEEKRIDNIYELLGGSKIKFGKPNIAPTVNPLTGHALFFENSDRFGVNVVDRQRRAIMGENNNLFWNSTGGGTKGQFIKYTANSGKKYLYSYYIGSAAACYSGGWWTGKSEVQYCVQNYPFGSGAQNLGEAIILSSSWRQNVDSYISIYREVKYSELDLEYWTSSGSINTSNNKIFLSTDNFKKLDSRMWTASNATGTTNYGSHSANHIQITNIRIYSWNTETGRNYNQLVPGFYNRTQYENNLYGGVQLCESERNGEITLNKLNFLRYEKDTAGEKAKLVTGKIYFAISDEPFTNTDDFFGNVKITENSAEAKTTEIASSDGKTYKYYIPSSEDINIKFNCKVNKTYYIKCQVDRTITANNFSYVCIKDGMEVIAKYE